MVEMVNPTHAGIWFKEEVLDERGIGVNEAARLLGVARPHLSHVLNGNRPLSVELAVKMEAAFGFKADVLVRMQANHELAQARMNAETITASVTRYQPVAA